MEVFVLDQDYDGLQVVNLKNWSGRAFIGHRKFLKNIKDHDGMKSPSIYFLLKSEPDEESGNFPVYIGESESFSSRISGHKEKLWWDKFICFTSADDSITKAHVKYLEKWFFDYLNNSELPVVVENTHVPTGASLPNSDECFLGGFADNMLFILRTMGIDYFEETPESFEEISTKRKVWSSEYKDYSLIDGKRFTYTIPRTDKSASMRVENGKCVLEKGSYICTEAKQSFNSGGYYNIWSELIGSDLVEGDRSSGLVRLKVDQVYDSPSLAGAVVYGGRFAGPKYWLESETGKRFKQIQTEIIKNAA